MKNFFIKIRKIFQKNLNRAKDILINTVVYFVYYNLPIKGNLIYVESQSGDALNGNLLRICEELNKEEYKEYKVVVRAKISSRQKISELVKTYNLNNVTVVDRRVLSLYYMERAKYIFLDAGDKHLY